MFGYPHPYPVGYGKGLSKHSEGIGDVPSSIPQMLQSVDLEFVGQLHSSKDDSYNLAHMIIYCKFLGIELIGENIVLACPLSTDPTLTCSETQDSQ